MSNYPMGAKEDPNAPYNKKEEQVMFSYSISGTDSIITDGRNVKENICEYLKEVHGNDIEIDFLEII